MSSKHLSTGSTCPPAEVGKVRIYSMRFCPFAHRALLVVAAKEIPHDVVNCNLRQKPEFLLEKNALGKVPTIETPRGILYESLVVCDFLDESFPGRVLNPVDSFEKATDRIWMENFNTVTPLFYKSSISFGISNDSELEKVLQDLINSILPFEKELSRRSTKFFAGNECPGMLDYMIWPWMERLPMMKLLHPDKFDYLSFKRSNPELTKWDKSMREDKTVQKFLLSPETYYKYTSSSKAGTPNYDMLEQSKTSFPSKFLVL